ncbi:MAG: hypothetical protein EOP49_40835 [Sphingobacteriales bacterium]|nr:MAG: hypothetical protein EOP49_40835 [Sphingobacteriales bacterium]
MPIIKASLKFWEAYTRRKVIEQNGIEIPFISLDDLIQDKQAIGRPKDLADIENLKRNNPPQVS